MLTAERRLRILSAGTGEKYGTIASGRPLLSVSVEVMSLCSERDRTDLLSRSFRFLGGELKGTADETLFLELALRGYDLSKLRDPANETTAEIIKIG